MRLLFTQVHFLFWQPSRVVGQYTTGAVGRKISHPPISPAEALSFTPVWGGARCLGSLLWQYFFMWSGSLHCQYLRLTVHREMTYQSAHPNNLYPLFLTRPPYSLLSLGGPFFTSLILSVCRISEFGVLFWSSQAPLLSTQTTWSHGPSFSISHTLPTEYLLTSSGNVLICGLHTHTWCRRVKSVPRQPFHSPGVCFFLKTLSVSLIGLYHSPLWAPFESLYLPFSVVSRLEKSIS